MAHVPSGSVRELFWASASPSEALPAPAWVVEVEVLVVVVEVLVVVVEVLVVVEVESRVDILWTPRDFDGDWKCFGVFCTNYFIYSCILGLISCSVFLRINYELKMLIMLTAVVVYNVIILQTHAPLLDEYSTFLYRTETPDR
ncbi:hypothetical protein CRUP_035727 [Coryphaenoides rupestris]|nr:hypothetical protein CRUP_035727 [Coryphaenoides rupestris]